MNTQSTFNQILFLVGISFILSCSKTENEVENNSVEEGSLFGTVRLFDRFGDEKSLYEDVTIDLVDTNMQTYNSYVDSNGNFQIKGLPISNMSLSISNPEYVGRDSIVYSQTDSNVELPEIVLLEKLPFKFTISNFDYSNGKIIYSQTINYETNENYLIGWLFCYGKDPNTSIYDYEFLDIHDGTLGNVNFIDFVTETIEDFNIDNLLSNGFTTGDTVYVVSYPYIEKFPETHYAQRDEFGKLFYSMDNPSNAFSFILD